MQNSEKRRRNEYDIRADILRVVKKYGRAGKTKIVYEANLNFTVLRKYLREMGVGEGGLGLLRLTPGNPNPKRSKIEITERGLEYLGWYDNLTGYSKE